MPLENASLREGQIKELRKKKKKSTANWPALFSAGVSIAESQDD